ncbi:MAG: radical SAM protein [Bryobacterales bacterium]|nr:radical SAM protein [Bryobacterales bacterium]
MQFPIHHSEAKSILSSTTGFIAQAGFTHSLTPARNCTFGCTYCYVPTMGIYGGLKREDWTHWGQFTTFKANAAALLRKSLKPHQIIYCSPLVDPYQPAEEREEMMPAVLDAVIASPPLVFAIQTRAPLVLRDLDRLRTLSSLTTLRVGFSITTNDERVRRLYEPQCASFESRLEAVRRLREAGVSVVATLAPVLPCDPEALVRAAIDATGGDPIGDPFHVRATKSSGATTRDAGFRISLKNGYEHWHDPAFQASLTLRMQEAARAAGRRFTIGPEAFAALAQPLRT